MASLSTRLALFVTLTLAAVVPMDPAAADADPKCASERAAIVGTSGHDVIKAPGKGKHVVVGLGGDDLIVGRDGHDVICGGAGDDVINGGRGRDQLFGGSGRDRLEGGVGKDKLDGARGKDTLIGGPGGEQILGGPGADRLYGGQQDDALVGERGDDVLIGDQGADTLRGAAGNDWMRGDSERDFFHGGSGDDWLSFATTTGPGVAFLDGVKLDVRDHRALGDEAPEPIDGVENYLGSPLRDRFRGFRSDGGVSPGRVRGLAGADICEGFASIDCGGGPRPGDQPVASVDPEARDPGLLIMGATGTDHWGITPTRRGAHIDSTTPLAAGPGCQDRGSDGLVCAAAGTLGYLLVFGDAGDDSIRLAGSSSPVTFVKLDGGAGTDQVVAGAGSQSITSGFSTALAPENDALFAGRGEDVLDAVSGGARLHGGSGADQLVTGGPCGGMLFDGGSGGPDIAGFAQTPTSILSQPDGSFLKLGIHAAIGGKAFSRGFPDCRPTRVLTNNEVLEGSSGNDVLFGSKGADALIVGRGGDDIIHGRAGADVLRGEKGRDSLFGDGGADVLEARDGERDRRLDCGPGGRKAIRDRKDPMAKGC